MRTRALPYECGDPRTQRIIADEYGNMYRSIAPPLERQQSNARKRLREAQLALSIARQTLHTLTGPPRDLYQATVVRDAEDACRKAKGEVRQNRRELRQLHPRQPAMPKARRERPLASKALKQAYRRARLNALA